MRKLLQLPLLLASLAISVPAFAKDDGIESLRQTGKAFAAVARQVSPSVVFIQVEEQRQATGESLDGGFPFGDDLFRRFFGDDFPGMSRRPSPHPAPRQQRKTIGQGSGFVFANGGEVSYLLTNSHVVENAEKIRVKLQDGREFDARIKGTDPKSDVAVLEIPARGLPALKWGDSARLEVGEWVVALGNPFGLSHTLTAGVVSAKGRTSLGISDYEDFIQTDAAINPGNSGGPLLNLDGEVVGMNTAIFSRSGGYMGVGFAIPSNLARAMAEQLVSCGKVLRGYIGLTVQPLTPDIAETLGQKERRGVLVNQVNENSPAERACVRPGYVLVSLDGVPLSDGGQYRNQAAQAKPGSTVAVGLIRDGRRLDVPVKVAHLDDEAVQAAETAKVLGLAVRGITPEEARRFRVAKAVLATSVEPGSLAAMAGIGPGTLILEANRKPVGSPGEFSAALGEAAGSVLLRILDNGNSRYVTLRWR